MTTTVSVGRVVAGSNNSVPQPVKTRRRKMTIIPEGSSRGITVRYAPREVEHTNISATWEEIPRANRMPLIVRQPTTQPRMAFTLYFGSTDPFDPVAAQLRELARYSRGTTRLRVNYSTWEDGLWRISSMSITTLQRHPVTDEITRAEVAVEFVLAADLSTHIGPVTGGVKPPQSGTPPKTPPKTRKYKIKRGDTLMKIAHKFYKDSSKWRKIAKANKIKNPRKLKVGRIITIP